MATFDPQIRPEEIAGPGMGGATMPPVPEPPRQYGLSDYAKAIYRAIPGPVKGPMMTAAGSMPVLGPAAQAGMAGTALATGIDNVNAYDKNKAEQTAAQQAVAEDTQMRTAGGRDPVSFERDRPAAPRPGITMVGGGGGGAFEQKTTTKTQDAAREHAVQVNEEAARQVHDIAQTDAFKARLNARADMEAAAERQKAAEEIKQRNLAQLRQADQDVRTKVAEMGDYKEDPGRVWNNKSDFQKVATTIAAGLAGFLQGYRGQGGSNPVWDRLEKTMDRDVAAQRAAYQAKKDKVAEAKSDYDRIANQIGVEGADEMIKAAMRDQAVAKAQEQAAAKGYSEQQQGYIQTLANLSAKRDENIANSVKLVHASAKEPMLQVPGLPIPVTRAEYFGILKDGLVADKKNAADDRERFVPTGDGRGFMAAGKEEGKDIREQFAAARDTVNQIDRIMELRKKTGTLERTAGKLGVKSADVGALEAAGKQVGVGWSKAQKMGTWDAGTASVVGDITGDPAAILNIDERKLMQLRGALVDKMKTVEASQTGQGMRSTGPTSFRPDGAK